MNRLACALLLLVASSAVFAAPFKYTWQLSDLVRSSGETVDLRDDKGRLLKRVNHNQLVYIYSAMQAIREAGEIDALAIIIDGDAPNAFATRGKAELKPAGGGEKGAEPEGKDPLQGKSVEDHKINEENAVDINIMAINFAMLDMLQLNVHMMAALIGHELAHLKLNHGEESEKNRRSMSMQNAASTKYSRDNEREADYLGAVWAVEAGYDPHGAVELQEMLLKSYRGKGGGVFVGSHPSSTERIAVLKALARRLSPKP